MGMARFWLKFYPQGVPSGIDCSKYRSLAELLDESFRDYAGRDAFACMDQSITYAELDRYSLQLGAWLQSRGLKKGARVALMMPNVLQSPIALAGILRAGYVVVNINPLYTPRELRHQLQDSGAQAIVILENFAATLQQVIHETEVAHVIVASMGEMLGSVKGAAVDFILRKDASLTAEQLTGYCRRELTGYKKPKIIEFRSDLPKTNVGKILRRDLRQAGTAA